MAKTVATVCPNCGKSDFTNSCQSYFDDEMSFQCDCNNCKATWFNWYKLTYSGYTYNNESYDEKGNRI